MAETAATFIPNHFRDAFATNWDFAAQQIGSRLSSYVTIEEVMGERKRFNRYAQRANLTVKEGRATATKVRDQESDLRWLLADEYDDAVRIDEFDEVQLADITGPKSGLIQSMMNAANRTADRVILDGLAASVYTGKSGTGGPSTFDTSNQLVAANFSYGADGVTAGTSGGPFSLDKIRRAKEIMSTAEALQDSGPDSRPVIVARAKDLDKLYGFLQTKSLDVQLPKMYDQKLVESIIGCDILHSEQVYDDGTNAWLYMWIPSGVKFAAGQWKTYMDILPTQSHALQCRITGRMGAMRYDDKKVVRIQVTK
jgi:hypothetical protein